MKKSIPSLLALALLVSPAAARAQGGPGGASMDKGAQKLTIDTTVSKIDWVARKITRKHDGGFRSFRGTILFADGDPGTSHVDIDIETASIFTDTDNLTNHLKTADFFDVAKFPKAVFHSQKIRPATADTKGATHIIVGTLEIKGVKKPVSFPATIKTEAGSVSATATFPINRKDFGLLYPGKPDDLIADEVVITFDVKAPRPAKS